jgi:hypothetical protein
MSTDYYDCFEDGCSDCCGSNIILGGICQSCGEHCDEMEDED